MRGSGVLLPFRWRRPALVGDKPTGDGKEQYEPDNGWAQAVRKGSQSHDSCPADAVSAEGATEARYNGMRVGVNGSYLATKCARAWKYLHLLQEYRTLC